MDLWDRQRIDDVSNLVDRPVFVFSATEDSIVNPINHLSQKLLFESLGADVVYEEAPVDHAEPFSCESLGVDAKWCIRPMLDRMLSFLYEDTVDAWNSPDPDFHSKGVLRHFWQADYLDTYLWQKSSLAPLGYIFYPNQCIDGTTQCKLHIHLHGCGFSARVQGFVYPLTNQFFDIAVANDLIVVFPQIQKSFVNLDGCWDSSGYTGRRYKRHGSVQGEFLLRLIDQITNPLNDRFDY